MIDKVSVFRLAQLVLQLRGVVLCQLGGQPLNHLGTFDFGGLLLGLPRGHLLDEELLLHLVENIEAGLGFDRVEIIKLQITFLLPFIMARETIFRDKLRPLLGHRRKSKHPRGNHPPGEPCKDRKNNQRGFFGNHNGAWIVG